MKTRKLPSWCPPCRLWLPALLNASVLRSRGKTTLLNVLAEGHPLETCPTIGLNVKRVKRGGVNLKCWCVHGRLPALLFLVSAVVLSLCTACTCRDIGGQKQYRSEWARYTKGCNVIIFVVDTYAVCAFVNSHVVSRQLTVVVHLCVLEKGCIQTMLSFCL